MYQTSKGIRFHAELFQLLRDNNLMFDFDIFDEYCNIVFEEDAILNNDVILSLFSITCRFDLLVEARADSNCIVFEFHKK